MADAVGYILLVSIAVVWTVLLCMVYRNRPRSNPEEAHRMFEGCRGAASAGAKRGGRG